MWKLRLLSAYCNKAAWFQTAVQAFSGQQHLMQLALLMHVPFFRFRIG